MSSGIHSPVSLPDSLDRPTRPLATVFGTAIALLTLILPLWAIGYYSGGSAPVPPPDYALSRTE